MLASRLYSRFICRCVFAWGARTRRKMSTSGRSRSMPKLTTTRSPMSELSTSAPPVAYQVPAIDQSFT